MRGSPKLPVGAQEAKLVKDMLYAGKPQAHIAAVLGISQSSVSRIKHGDIHEDIPWPTGDVGGLPDRIHAKPGLSSYWSDITCLYNDYPEELQQRILEVVNIGRASADLPPIPEIDPEYIHFLEMDEEDKVWEPTAAESAQLAEDRRISRLMREFDDLIAEQSAQKRGEEIFTILHATAESSVEEVPAQDEGILVYKKMPWHTVLELGSRVPVIKEALGIDNPYLIEACCIVFHELKNTIHSWKNSAVEVQIRKLARKLEKEGTPLDEATSNHRSN